MAHRIFLFLHVQSSSLTRDHTRAPCIGSAAPWPLDHEGSPKVFYNENQIPSFLRLKSSNDFSVQILEIQHNLKLMAMKYRTTRTSLVVQMVESTCSAGDLG